ncbi:hypothetical protein FA95DRAFT_246456 [Auriscalpium vulgare]|uniref:Uncharacterized protein n=1 Tax=Auriscalpium vulgare TaxID=40419 RepID=A0ACB8RKZ7_9AGAM|nr:hypothetical protein FA95DRAFT_246456 [Auriscalpium vulgare]
MRHQNERRGHTERTLNEQHISDLNNSRQIETKTSMQRVHGPVTVSSPRASENLKHIHGAYVERTHTNANIAVPCPGSPTGINTLYLPASSPASALANHHSPLRPPTGPASPARPASTSTVHRLGRPPTLSTNTAASPAVDQHRPRPPSTPPTPSHSTPSHQSYPHFPPPSRPR